MVQALGQLPNAPLIYVLAQVRFTPVPRMDRRSEDFHDKIFEKFPKRDVEKIDEIAIKQGRHPTIEHGLRWHYSDEPGTKGIVLDAGMLVFHTTNYQTSDAFLTDLKFILDALKQVLPEIGVSVTRLGLRYVDLLLPEEELPVDKQVIQALRLPNLPDIGEAQRMEQIVRYNTEGIGVLVIRHRQSKKTDVLPSDIFPNNLVPPTRLNRDQIEGEIVGLLDYDHYLEQRLPFDIDSVISNFRNLHEKSSAAFKATTTNEALDEWKKEIK